MEAIEHIIIDHTLQKIGLPEYAPYLCHAYCHSGYATFTHNGKLHRFEAGNCLIISRRGDLLLHLQESSDFNADVIYVSQAFIELSTPASNYGMRGHLMLFHNPIIPLTPSQQKQCEANFRNIMERLADTRHIFRRDALRNAVECMIIDFFDFHASIYGSETISSTYHQIMEQFIEILERGDYRKHRSIPYYADLLCITPKYLSEVSKKVSGMSASYWITRYTALDISRMLRNRQLTVSDVCRLFDFSSLSHFNHFVQKNLGARPSEFRL